MSTEAIDQTPSRPFRGFDWSEHENVVKLIDALFAEYKIWYKNGGENRRLSHTDKIKQHLTHFVLEAYRTHQALPKMAMGVHLGNRYYNESKHIRYHPGHLSYRFVQNVTRFLSENGYLELPFGVSGWAAKAIDRRTTRYRATNKLIDLCTEYGINRFMIDDYPYGEPEIIILRKKKKRDQSTGDMVNYKDTDFTIQARKNLQKINKFISGHCLNLDITDEQHRELMLRLGRREDKAMNSFIDFTRIHLKRIFNNSSFEDGGRFYGAWWQQIPGDQRVFITINGKRTIQLDFSGMHFAIMYAEMGMSTPMADPYALKGYEPHLRKDIKTAFNIIINCANTGMAIGTINALIGNDKLSRELGGGRELIQAFADTHPLIKDKIASGEGVKGQFIDSQIAERVLLKAIDINLCILPIHDGFITTAGDQFILERLMNEAFEEITGQSANIKPETFDLSVLQKEGNNRPYWITRSDGTVEMEGEIEGKATAYDEIISSGPALWESLEDDSVARKIKNEREAEWQLAHNHK